MTISLDNYLPAPEELDKDSNASDWLKRPWRMAQMRDPFDAIHDDAILHNLCQARLLRKLKETEKIRKGEKNG